MLDRVGPMNESEFSGVNLGMLLRPAGNVPITKDRQSHTGNARNKKGRAPAPVLDQKGNDNRRNNSARSHARQKNAGAKRQFFFAQPIGHHFVAYGQRGGLTQTHSESNDRKCPSRSQPIYKR